MEPAISRLPCSFDGFISQFTQFRWARGAQYWSILMTEIPEFLTEDQQPEINKPVQRPRSQTWLKRLGPGLVTGAADDDPSGIATYSQIGAQFGFGLAWTLPFSFPLMAVIQEVSARIGSVTGRGLAQNLREHYGRPLLYGIVALLLIANVINLGADLGAMGAALGLMLGGPVLAYAIGFGLLCIVLEVFISYRRYAGLLKWSTLCLFAYVGVVFTVHLSWREALTGALIPGFVFDHDHAMALVAVLGTTISPYLFFWQAGQEVEEQHRRHVKPLCVTPRHAGRELARIRFDTYVGMGFSYLVALFIVFATAASLHVAGVTQIDTSAQAAEALRPIAGEFSFGLFALGIIGTGLLAVPVLAGSAAYAVSEMFDWTEGLDRQWKEAKAFYGVIAIATLGGALLNFTSLDPMKALYWSAVVNGVLAAPLMAVMMIMGKNPNVMGRFILSRPMTVMGWLATAIMAFASLLFFIL